MQLWNPVAAPRLEFVLSCANLGYYIMCTGVLSHRFTCASMNKKKRKKKKKKKTSMYNYSSSWINLTQSHGLSWSILCVVR
eukprot:m.89824 g.89824  ORF g.89824 m.89824 type:complete len:81 (+) comp20093_c0_seq1:1740-1982(+)